MTADCYSSQHSGVSDYADIGHDTPNAVLFYWSPKMGRSVWMATVLEAYHDGGPAHSNVVPQEYLRAATNVSGRVCHQKKMASIVGSAGGLSAQRAMEAALGRIKAELACLFPGYEIRQFE